MNAHELAGYLRSMPNLRVLIDGLDVDDIVVYGLEDEVESPYVAICI
jgi:hypothetical protein